MEHHAFRSAVRRVIDAIIDKITLLLGIFMLLYGIIGEYRCLEDNPDISLIVSFIPMIICGTLVVLDTHCSVNFASGLYAIALGSSRVISQLQVVLFEKHLFTFLLGMATFIIGLNMVYSGYKYLAGITRTIAFIAIGTLFLIFISVVNLYIALSGFSDWGSFIKMGGINLAVIVLCLLYLSIVCSETVRDGTKVAQINRVMTSYGVSQGVISNVSVDRPTSQRLVGFYEDPSGYEHVGAEGDPVTHEYRFVCSDGPYTLYGMLQRWHGDEEVYLYISGFKGGSVFDVKASRVVGMRLMDNYMFVDIAGHQTKVFRIRGVEEDDGPVRKRSAEATAS